MSETTSMFLLLMCVLASSSSQILLKKSANKKHKGIKIFLNRETIIGYGIFFCATMVMVYLHRFITLSTVVLMGSLSYVFVTALSRIFFQEKFKREQFIGIALIISGVVIFALFG